MAILLLLFSYFLCSNANLQHDEESSAYQRYDEEAGFPLTTHEMDLKVKVVESMRNKVYTASDSTYCIYNGTYVKMSYTNVGKFGEEESINPQIIVTVTKPYGYPQLTFTANHVHHSMDLYCDAYHVYLITRQSNFVLNGFKKISTICLYFDCDDWMGFQSDYVFPYEALLERSNEVDFNSAREAINDLDNLLVRWYNRTHYLVMFHYYSLKNEL